MKLTTFVAALAGGCLATSAMAQSDALAQIAELRAQLAAVQAQAGNNTLTEERAAEIKSIVRDTLADADTRTSLQGGGSTVGFDNGFFMSSADGNFKLKLGVLAQARFVWEFDTTETMGFENRRTQLAFGGNMFDPSWTYNAVINYAPYTTPYGEASGFSVADASVSKALDGGLSITGGQFRTPFTRATLVGDGKQLMADYSPTDYNFSAGYQQGVLAGYSADQFRAMFSIGNGIGNMNGTWGNDTTNATNLNFSVRGEFKMAGSWSQFAKETSFRGEEFGLLFGVGWLDTDGNGSGNYGSVGNNNALTMDATAFFGGANVSAAYTYANASTNAGDDSYGFSVQGGVFLTDSIEAWGGWNYIDGDVAFEAGNWIQFGANVYFAKNGCKWTTQINVPINDATNSAYYFGGAWGLNSPTGDTSLLTQLQFMF
ncbi:MAG: hypothetical protein FJ254_04190 [Phycisphaerae bacterium]|nr:hypothetical protein [Phycisphaerae bacterium]